MLGDFRNMLPANIDALEDVLLRVSEMVCELPLLREMDINPLILDEKGALAADARVVVEYRQPSADRYAHMAIYPYPTHRSANGNWPTAPTSPSAPSVRRTPRWSSASCTTCPRNRNISVS